MQRTELSYELGAAQHNAAAALTSWHMVARHLSSNHHVPAVLSSPGSLNYSAHMLSHAHLCLQNKNPTALESWQACYFPPQTGDANATYYAAPQIIHWITSKVGVSWPSLLRSSRG